MQTGARAVVERYLDAMGSGDMAAVLRCFTEDVVLVMPDAVMRGIAAFAEECERMLAGLFAPGSYTRHNDTLVVEGDLAVLVWRADCLGTQVTHAVTHFLMRGDRIALVTSVAQSRPV